MSDAGYGVVGTCLRGASQHWETFAPESLNSGNQGDVIAGEFEELSEDGEKWASSSWVTW